MKKTVFDLETTMYSPVSQPAHPLWPMNRVVMWGHKQDEESHTSFKLDEKDERGSASLLASVLVRSDLVVGHNVKFDLLYMLARAPINEREVSRMKIWDTQLAEYLLTGQQATYASLDELAIRYGGVVKDSAVTEFFNAGKGADHVPEKMLTEYLQADLDNTALIQNAQYDLAVTYQMLPLIETQMEALKATILMEWNGMKVDRGYIDTSIKELTEGIVATEDVLHTLIKPLLPIDVATVWSWGSGKDVSMLLFGGVWKYFAVEEVGFFKNGKVKTKKMEKELVIKGMYDPAKFGTEKNKLGYYVVDEKVLRNIGSDITKSILSLRTMSKQKETYYEGLKGLVFLSGFVHPSLNHTATKTGRLSCNKPNIQNQTEEGGVKRAFVSRWGDEGSLVEFDYAQLEMVALAYVSDDQQLISDIDSGVDMHTALFIDMYGRSPTKDERKWFKRLSFGLVYGAGANTLAENAGCSVKDARKFIKVFYTRYPGVKSWHEHIVETAAKERRVSKEFDKESGMPIGKYVQSSVTGRRYVYREYFNEWKGGMSFSPTELKNYPVQGFATGDVVPFMVGIISKALVSSDMHDNAKFIMTVHDSMLFDVNNKILDMFIGRCYSILKNTTPMVNEMFNINLPVTLQVGCKVGSNWQDMTERKMAI